MECVQFSTARGSQSQRVVTEMKQDRALLTLALLLATISWSCVATAQSAKPTAAQDIQLSVFTAASGDYTGLSGGKNLSLTVGADLAFSTWHGTLPTLEFRGTYPIDQGKVVAQKDAMGGLRLDFLLGRRLHPYGNFLFGRGKMNYVSGGVDFNGLTYLVSVSYVYSPSAGFDYNLSTHLAIKVDGQFQHWGGGLPTASGNLYSSIGTVGLVYRFGRRGMP